MAPAITARAIYSKAIKSRSGTLLPPSPPAEKANVRHSIGKLIGHGHHGCAGRAGLSFDQPIRAHEQRLRHVEPKRLCRLEVDHKLEFRGMLDWQITRLGACSTRSLARSARSCAKNGSAIISAASARLWLIA